MAHKFDPNRMGSLTSERRYQAVQPLQLLQRAGLQPGDVVLDLGCGAGFFTLPAAQLVGPQGRVVAVDVQPEMVAATQAAVQRAHLSNVEVRLAPSDYELPTPMTAADWVILAYILHEVSDPQQLLWVVQQTLRPHGRLLIIEWPLEKGPHGPPLAERLSPANLATAYQPLGLTVQLSWQSGTEYYALVLA